MHDALFLVEEDSILVYVAGHNIILYTDVVDAPIPCLISKAAMKAALTDLVPEAELETRELVLIVVGAGRGPLVRAALRASEATGRR